jgi:hypothetical protein
MKRRCTNPFTLVIFNSCLVDIVFFSYAYFCLGVSLLPTRMIRDDSTFYMLANPKLVIIIPDREDYITDIEYLDILFDT